MLNEKEKKRYALKVSLLHKTLQIISIFCSSFKKSGDIYNNRNVSGSSARIRENKDGYTVFSLTSWFCAPSHRGFSSKPLLAQSPHIAQSHHVQLQTEETELEEVALNSSYFVCLAFRKQSKFGNPYHKTQMDCIELNSSKPHRKKSHLHIIVCSIYRF